MQQTQQAVVTQQPPMGIKSYIEAQEERVEKFLEGSTNIQAKSLINKFLFAIGQNDKLKLCNRHSLQRSLLFCAEKKLAPINGKVVLIPFGNDCQAILGVQGIRELIRRNPEVQRVAGDVVRQKDEFKLISGLEPTIHHIPNMQEESAIIGSYAFAEMNKGKYVIRYSTLVEIQASKDCSKGSASPSSPWNKFFAEMARLVPLRKLAKELITDEVSLSFDTDYDYPIRSAERNGNVSNQQGKDSQKSIQQSAYEQNPHHEEKFMDTDDERYNSSDTEKVL